jgi:phage terminase large subunit
MMSYSDSIRTRLELRRDIGDDPVKQAIELEYCRRNVVAWVNRWAWTSDPREARAVMPFVTFPRQAEFLLWLKERDDRRENGLAEKSRDVGFTWLCSYYALHCWLFRAGDSTGFGSRKLDLVDVIGNMDSIFEKIRFGLQNLPAWMRPAGFSIAKNAGYCKIVNPVNGASITGEGGDGIGRGGRKSRYFVDEAAFLERPDLTDSSLLANTDVRIDVSTPNGVGNSFYRKRSGGKVPVFTFHYTDDPRKTPEWAEKKRRDVTPAAWAQEYDIDYTASLSGICIPAQWVRTAVGLKLPIGSRLQAGMDVADDGANENVFITRNGPVTLDVLAWSHLNTTASAWRARDECQIRKVVSLHYDVVGVGSGVKGTFATAQRPLSFVAVAVNGGHSPTEDRWPDGETSAQKFLNLRAEMWWKLRRRFEKTFEYVIEGIQHPADEMISVPNHPQLIAQISMPLYFHTETGKVKIESKGDMRKRGVQSPDYADALVYAFDTPPHVASAPASAGARPSAQTGYTPR